MQSRPRRLFWAAIAAGLSSFRWLRGSGPLSSGRGDQKLAVALLVGSTVSQLPARVSPRMAG